MAARAHRWSVAPGRSPLRNAGLLRRGPASLRQQPLGPGKVPLRDARCRLSRASDPILNVKDLFARIHSETSIFEMQTSEIAVPRPGDQCSQLAAKPSWSRVSRSGAIQTGGHGASTRLGWIGPDFVNSRAFPDQVEYSRHAR